MRDVYYIDAMNEYSNPYASYLVNIIQSSMVSGRFLFNVSGNHSVDIPDIIEITPNINRGKACPVVPPIDSL